MTGIYFSGTGNSKHCTEQFVKLYDSNAEVFSIEDKSVIQAIKENDILIIGYPVQYSNIPKILQDFIAYNKDLWKGKRVYIIATMAMFSGDGAGILSRLLRKYGAATVGGLHLKMPDSICDEKVLKHSVEENRRIVINADSKIKSAVEAMKNGSPTQDGLRFYHRFIGLFGQRLYFLGKTKKYSSDLKIDPEKCIKCRKCVQLCPMKNITQKNDNIIQNDRCTMCYRCISRCPKKAITLLGNKVIEQCYIEKYL